MIKFDKSWMEAVEFPEGATEKQKKLLTPVVLTSDTITDIRNTYAQIFRATGEIFSSLILRYSYAIKIKNARKNITIVSLYYLEKDLNIALKDYKIVTHVQHIKNDDSKLIKEALSKVKRFELNCEDAYDKLIVTKINGKCFGWEVKEKFGKG